MKIFRPRYAVTHPWWGGLTWQSKKFHTKLGARRWKRQLERRFHGVTIEKI